MAEYYCPKPKCWGKGGPACYGSPDLLAEHLRVMHHMDVSEQWVRDKLHVGTLDG